ncbi:MAG: hypothetical protein ACT4OI_02970, partial [Methanobacteriota archaeon]
QGAVAEAQGDAYLAYLKETGIREYRATRGNRGVVVLRRNVRGRTEFLLLTLWESYGAIRSFAGPDLERAVYYPRDEAVLLERSPTVDHYDVVLDSRPRSRRGGRGDGRVRTLRRRTR